jgi:hypothetical protein
VPIRQSALDKAKAEARAKKLRDEKEAASALEDFVKEFDVDVSEEREWRSGGVEGGMKYSSAVGAGGRVNMGAGRRHFTTAPKVVPLVSSIPSHFSVSDFIAALVSVYVCGRN